MQVIIEKIANDVNFVGQIVGHVYQTHVYDDKDVVGIVACVLSAISQKDDLTISFSEQRSRPPPCLSFA